MRWTSVVAVLVAAFCPLLACTQNQRELPAGASEIQPPATCASSLQIPHASFSTPARDSSLIDQERGAIREQIEARMALAGLDGAVAALLCSGFRCVRVAVYEGEEILCAWPDRVPVWRRPAPPEQWCVHFQMHEGSMTPYVLFNDETRRYLP